ncbi:MAG: T9SS type A sorting domain-containing protein [Sphingobacteriales bacterium JAD_PAG50586_3]|nr:MAG: T9SS type A sorting domain-containing protein [Sphingobacteriales bacterium JAD_PAG50586_3]
MSIQISLNNGSTWNTLLTYFGNSDYLIPFSGSSVSLAYNANAQYTRPATQSTFSVQLPTGTTQFMFRMTGTNNRTNENWCIDNITLIGTAIPVNNPSPLPTANGGTISTCPNTNNTLTVTTANTVGTITYAWSPTTNMNPPAGNISNPVVNPPGNTVYSVTVTDADNCKATATRTISVPGGAAGTWTGVVDNDWFQCRNWGNGVVPTTTTNVTIPNGIINIATIDPQSSFATPFSGIAYSNNLTINSGGKLIGIYGSNLRVSGNWNNNGIFNPGDGTVNFTGGSGTATINGSAAQAFNSIAINKSVQLLTDASVSSIGTLAVNNTLDLNAKTLTVLNATNTAITRTAPGYVLSEEQDGSARLLWSINSFSYIDDYIFPMGNAAGNYIPVTFKLNSGDIGFAGVATYKSTGALASNWPTGTETVTNVTNPAQAVQRFWHLESDQPANNYNADVTFTYPTAEDPTLGAGVNVQFQRYNKPTNTWDFPLVTQTYSPNATRSVLVEGITKFSWWGGGNDNTNPLPVELVSFKGNCNANTVTITWETATETNNDYFTIQRSRNLIEYEDVAIVQGSGNSNTLKAYSVTDENPLTGTSYYRLLQTDFNGEYEVFNSIAVGCADNGIATITVYPNPATSVLNIQVNNGATGKGFITLYNQLGQRVITEGISTSVGINTYTINTDNLPAGQYFVQFVMDNTALPVQKIVITD